MAKTKHRLLTTFCILLFAFCIFLTACGDKSCDHTYDNACDTTCNECDEERSITHTPNDDDGDCTTEITCSVCGTITTPAKDSHTGGTATCTAKAECTECGTAYGTVDGNNHIDENTDHICDRECGKTDIGTHADSAEDNDHVCDYGCGVTLSNHEGGNATCTELATCGICGLEYGEYDTDNHTSTEFTYSNIDDDTHKKAHKCCGKISVDSEAHTFDPTDGACQFCEVAMAEAKVTTSGKTVTYYETLMDSLTAAKSGDTVTLCKDVKITERHTIPAGVIFYGGEYIMTGSGAGWVENKGTIENGKFDFAVTNRGIVNGGEFTSSLHNFGTVNGGSFDTITCNPGSTLSGAVTINGSLNYWGKCTIDLSNAVFGDGVELVNGTEQELSISSLQLPDGYAVEVDGAVVSVLPAWESGSIVSHSHTYEAAFDDTHHWTECACGKTTEPVDHTLTYTAEGNIITESCSEKCGYTKTATITAEDTIYDGNAKETANVNYSEGWMGEKPTASYENNTNAGTATASITIDGAKAEAEFTIAKATPTIAWDSTNASVEYTGSAATITAPKVTLVNGETFNGTISYSYIGTNGETINGLPTNAGTYEITASIDAQGNYNAENSTNTLTLTIKAKVLTEDDVTVGNLNDSYVYTGEQITPEITVTVDGKTLTKGDDYEVTYGENKYVYAAENDGTVTITFKGNYEGTITKTFEIVRAPDTQEFEGEWVIIPEE